MAHLKYCSCGAIIDKVLPRCDACQIIHDDKKKMSNAVRHKVYDETKRNKEHSDIYKSRLWKCLTKKVKDYQKGLCVRCWIVHKIVNTMRLSHHIEPIEDNVDMAFDRKNLIGLCDKCHRYVHDQYDISDDRKKEVQKELSQMAVLPFNKWGV